MFEKGKIYRLKYDEVIPTHRWRGTNRVSQSRKDTIEGNYEFIGTRGNKLHFYDSERGIDKMFSKKEAKEALVEN